MGVLVVCLGLLFAAQDVLSALQLRARARLLTLGTTRRIIAEIDERERAVLRNPRFIAGLILVVTLAVLAGQAIITTKVNSASPADSEALFAAYRIPIRSVFLVVLPVGFVSLVVIFARAVAPVGHVPQGGVTVHHPYQLLAGSLQQHLLA